VVSFLQSRDYLEQLIRDPSGERVIAVFGDQEVEYLFYRGDLYSITISKGYGKRKVAERTFSGCLDYMHFAEWVPVQLVTYDKSKHFAAFHGDRILECYLIPEETGDYSIRFTSQSKDYGPGQYRESFLLMANVLDGR
jgi:hypothetical protein